MPVHEVKKKGKVVGYQWGSQKIYSIAKLGIKRAKTLAQKQGKAIYLSGWRGD